MKTTEYKLEITNCKLLLLEVALNLNLGVEYYKKILKLEDSKVLKVLINGAHKQKKLKELNKDYE